MIRELKHVAIAMVFTGVMAQSAAEEQWTAGVVGVATYQEQWSPAVLPWISYRNDWFTINPMKAAFIGQTLGVQWEAGIGLDYAALSDNVKRSPLMQLDTQAFVGPLRFTAAGANRISDPLQAWRASSAVGSQLPLGGGLLGAEVGLSSESADWNDDNSRTKAALSPTISVQYGKPIGQWQAMLIAKLQGESLTTEDSTMQVYTMLFMRSW